MSSNGGREVVFCHQCEDEWFRDEHGLRCRRCQSEFVEVIEPGNDPRATQSPAAQQHPLHTHDPWASQAPDPGEDDISMFDGTRHRSGPSSSSRQGSHPFPPPFPNLFGGLGNSMPYNRPFPLERASGIESTETEHTRSRSVPGHREPNVRIAFSRGGPGQGFMFSSTTYGGNGPHGDLNGMGDINNMMAQLLGNLGARPMGQPGAASQRRASNFPQGMDPLSAMLNNMFGGTMGIPHGHNFGDFVSDGNFDNILSQLMEQHQSGNAPGPASEAAIKALPQIPVSKKHLGDEGKAECTICMSDVNIGDIITELPCHHWYHPECIEAWLKEHDTCAVCREGITPKEGSGAVRRPGQEPLHNESPAVVARRQSGTRENPIFAPESPAQERRRRPYSGAPGLRRHSSGLDQRVDQQTLPGSYPAGREQRSSEGRSGGGGLFDRARNLWNGGSNSRR